jgi:chemosensory pili system protein ChpC
VKTVPDQIYAALCAIPGDTLLIPNLAVAEVLSREALKPVPNAPEWMEGLLNWHNKQVPVISFEKLNRSAGPPQPGRRTRILVLYAVSHQLPTDVFGLLTEGYPHLVTLNRNAVSRQPLLETDRADVVVARARVASQMPAIPSFRWIEREIAAVLQPEEQPVTD